MVKIKENKQKIQILIFAVGIFLNLLLVIAFCQCYVSDPFYEPEIIDKILDRWYESNEEYYSNTDYWNLTSCEYSREHPFFEGEDFIPENIINDAMQVFIFMLPIMITFLFILLIMAFLLWIFTRKRRCKR